MASGEELSRVQCEEILRRNSYGRLTCYSPAADECYAVPMSYDFIDGTLYFVTLEGQKLRHLREHPHGVCLLVDEVDNEQSWSSVVATGNAEELAGTERLAQEAQSLRRAWGGALHYLFERYSQDAIRQVLRIFALRITKLTGRRERWDRASLPQAVHHPRLRTPSRV